MKKTTLLVVSFLFSAFFYAQEAENTQETENTQEVENISKIDKLGNDIDYNRWSIEANIGQNKPIRPFGNGFSSGENTNFEIISGNYHYDFGVRYMFNPNFGLKLDGAYDFIEASDRSIPFETELYRVGLQGVVNLRSLMNFQTWTNTFGLLGHGGFLYSTLEPKANSIVDENVGFMVGITPQVRLSNHFVLTADFTYLGLVNQHLNFDGTQAAINENLTGSMYNFSLGLTVYLGKHDKHADFYFVDETEQREMEKKMVQEKFDELEEKIAEANENIEDKADGMRNYIMNNYYSKEQVDNLIPSLKDFGFGNIFFEFDSDEPESSSINQIAQLVDYLNNNPSQNIELVGYTDILGSEAYNDGLSLRRAKSVNDILVNAGIDQSRIEFNGDGINPDYNDKKDDFNRMLARRVMVIFK